MNHTFYLVRQAWAGLVLKKGFLTAIVSTLGVTLGALLCILTLAYVVILKPLPYPDQENLYKVNTSMVDPVEGNEFSSAISYPSLMYLYENQSVFSQSALVRYENNVLSSQPTQPTVKNTYVTPSWFELLGSKMILGRSFENTEDIGSFNPVAILSHEIWQREFNSERSVIGKTVTIGSTSFKVVGVLDKSFIEPQLAGIGEKTDIFLPWDYNFYSVSPRHGESFGNFSHWHSFVGKLSHEFSINQAEQTLSEPINRHWTEGATDLESLHDWQIKLELQPLKHVILADSEKTILLLLAAVVGLLLIACANITNLFMSRTADQQRELAIQAAVGANKGQLFQTLFAQSCLLVFISMLVALVIASSGFWILQQYLEQRLPRVDELSMNSVTYGAAFVIALLLGAFFAKVSAGMINYQALNSALQSSGKGTGIQVSARVRRWLIISQVTFVTLLVFVNIDLLRDSLKVIYKPLGFETENIATLQLKVGGELSGDDVKALSLELRDKLKALPQVEDVSLSPSPLSYNGSRILTTDGTEERLTIRSKYIDDRYFQITGQALVEGNFFSEDDFRNDNQRIIINDVYARKLVPNGSALGTILKIASDRLSVVGVVKSVKMPTEAEVPMRAYMRNSWQWEQFIIKLKPNQSLSQELAIEVTQGVSRQFYVRSLTALNDQRDQQLFTQFTTAITSAVLALLTFSLAAIGLYGILSYATQMRKFELGTRLAIGAKRMDVINLIVKDNLEPVAIGMVVSLVIMLGLYLGFSDLLASYVDFELIPIFSVTIVLIGLMALFACYWPLRPIINTPPVKSLRGSQ